MSSSKDVSTIGAVRRLSQVIEELRRSGVIRSRRFTADLGEWYIEQLYIAKRASSPTQKGWDLIDPTTGERLQVKTQTYDPGNRWNYLESDTSQFDRLVVVILTGRFTLRDLYDVPVLELRSLLRRGKDGRLRYHWDDLEPWRVNPRMLPGYTKLAGLIETQAEVMKG